MANKQLHVDGRFVVDAPAHADGGGIASEHHARQAYVLRHDHVASLQALDNGKVGAIGSHTHIECRDPKAPTRMLGVARVVAANVAFQVLRAVAGDNDGDARPPRAVDRLTRDRAGVSINKKRLWHLAHQFAKLNGADNERHAKHQQRGAAKDDEHLGRPQRIDKHEHARNDGECAAQDGEGAVGGKLGFQNRHDALDDPAKAGDDHHERGERRGREGLVAQDYDAAQNDEQVGDDARNAPAGGQQRLENSGKQPDRGRDHKVDAQDGRQEDEGLGGRKQQCDAGDAELYSL